jgi:hypothetical protein
MTTAQRVTREINLIARQFECLGAERAAQATADHIRKFWAPLLKTTLLSEANSHRDRFSPAASQAIQLLS